MLPLGLGAGLGFLFRDCGVQLPTGMSKNIDDELQRTARQAMAGLRPVRQGEEVGGLPFRRLLSAVFRARYLVFGTTLFGILVGTFLAITTANSYVSTGKFLFTASGAESRRLDPTRATETSQETIGSGATYILSTDGLLQRVVDRVGAKRILAPYQPANPDASTAKAWFYKIQRDWNATKPGDLTPSEALKRLRRTIHIERPRFTDVLVATCAANEPGLAQEILAVYLDEAVKWHIEKYEDKAAYDAAELTATQSRAESEVASNQLRSFLKEHAIADFVAEKERLHIVEAEAASRLTKYTDDLEIQRRVLADLNKSLEGPQAIPRYITEKRKLDITTEALNKLGDRLADLETERTRLLGQLRDPQNSQIQEKDKLISQCMEAMRRLSREAVNAEEVEVQVGNPDYASAQERRNEAVQEVSLLETKTKMAAEFDREAKARLKALLDIEPEFQKLNTALVQSEDVLEAAEATWLAAQQKRALGKGNFSSLKKVEDASLPLEKEAPNRSRLILAATLVGLFVGLGLVLLIALPDNIVRTREDLEDLDGLPVIGVMPRLDSRNLKRHLFRRRRGW